MSRGPSVRCLACGLRLGPDKHRYHIRFQVPHTVHDGTSVGYLCRLCGEMALGVFALRRMGRKTVADAGQGMR